MQMDAENFNSDMSDPSNLVTPTTYSRYEIELWDKAKEKYEAELEASQETTGESTG